jgi:hypothetical protein
LLVAGEHRRSVAGKHLGTVPPLAPSPTTPGTLGEPICFPPLDLDLTVHNRTLTEPT